MTKWNWRSPAALLTFIVVLAAVLRIVRLHDLPPALFRDEAEKAYNAFSILQTGRDVEGRFLPIFLHVFGVTTSAIYQYAAIPFIAVFGLNEWGARLPAACVGTLTLLCTFLLVREFRNTRTALWAALLLALSPWHIVFSRWAQQGIFLPLVLSVGAYGLYRGVGFRNVRKSESELSHSKAASPQDYRSAGALILSAVAFGLAIYAYDVARLFVPLLLLVAFACYWRALVRRPATLAIAALAFLLAASPTIYLMLTQSDAAQARFRFVTILQPGSTPLEVARTFAANYFAHWSPSFLLLHGDPELRHGAGIGVLTLLELLGLLAGIFVLLKEHTRTSFFWMGWLLLFPVAASLTRVGIPHALRTIVALPAIQVVAAIGLEACTQHIRIPRRNAFEQLLVLLACLTFLPFGLRYFSRQYAAASAFSWQYGVKQALAFCNESALQGSTIYMHNVVGAEYLVPFYTRANPRDVQASWSAMPNRLGPYVYMPFQPQDRMLTVSSPSPAAYISPAGPYTWPSDWRPLAYYPAGDERYPPVMFVWLNPALRQKLE